ncbi:hypothetical protein [Domibacillus robiginosus]|uniref:hypothetical protein n=1 Tax=Domibacillus robiginosus TaxID=1071054 RepID=UPI00067CF736|nr:hypothetical protein [Domibacillus robiginosus]
MNKQSDLYFTKFHFRAVIGQALPIRMEPSETYGQSGVLGQNEKVKIAYNLGSWALVQTESNIIGFVPRASLKE